MLNITFSCISIVYQLLEFLLFILCDAQKSILYDLYNIIYDSLEQTDRLNTHIFLPYWILISPIQRSQCWPQWQMIVIFNFFLFRNTFHL